MPLIRRESSYPKGPLSTDVRGESGGARGSGKNKPGGLVDYDEVMPHFREATWEEALDLAASRLKAIHGEHGAGSIAGHALLAVPDNLMIVYAALACLVIGNGFFKPNVSSMVGNLYTEGSHLKDKAYLIFYMGINVGAALAPIVAGFIQRWRLGPQHRASRSHGVLAWKT